MHELPEVETVRQQLSRTVVGKKILAVEILYLKAVRPVPPAAFVRQVRGAIIKAVKRRAKLVLIELSNGNTLVTHLKMTGHLFLKRDVEPRKPSHEIIFDLSGPTRMIYDDVRRFGFVRLMKTKELAGYFEKQYGPEPLDTSFTAAKFKALLAKKPRLKIKPLLIDQKFLAGIGNIYAQEACFYARVLPTRAVGTLTDKEIKALHTGLVKILREAVKMRGTSSDAYRDIYGNAGNFLSRLKVYGRALQPCRRCRTILMKITLGGRGTTFCPKCQR